MRSAWEKWPWSILPVKVMRICPDCHTKVLDSAIFCETCGYPLGAGPAETVASSSPVERTVVGEVKPGTCSSCGYQNVAGEMFCLNCGVQLAPVASIPPPLPTPASQVGWAPAPATTFWQCPVCNAPVEPEDDFCDNCGTNLSTTGAPPVGAQEPVEPGSLVAPPKIAIHLVVQSNNSVIVLDMKHDEWLVGRADPARGIFPRGGFERPWWK